MKNPTNIVAPKKIHMTIAVALSVAIAASPSVSQVSRRCNAQTTRAPKVPMPAASTGVATPKKMIPSTSKMTSTGVIVLRNNRSFSGKLTRSLTGNAGPSLGLM